MKLGIDLSQPSTIRGLSRLIFGIVSVYFLHKGDATGAVGALTAGKFIEGGLGAGLKD